MNRLPLLILFASSLVWAQDTPRSAEPVVIAPGVVVGLRTKMVQPVYPAEAKQAHIQGAVRLRAIIGKDGLIKQLTPIEAPSQELLQASLDAVSQWAYRPYQLNGEPVEVLTEITVNFKLN